MFTLKSHRRLSGINQALSCFQSPIVPEYAGKDKEEQMPAGDNTAHRDYSNRTETNNLVASLQSNVLQHQLSQVEAQFITKTFARINVLGFGTSKDSVAAKTNTAALLEVRVTLFFRQHINPRQHHQGCPRINQRKHANRHVVAFQRDISNPLWLVGFLGGGTAAFSPVTFLGLTTQ